MTTYHQGVSAGRGGQGWADLGLSQAGPIAKEVIGGMERPVDHAPVAPDGGGRQRVAVVQVPSVVLDRRATLARAVEKVGEAADNGARLVAFSEAFVPGYPDWTLRLRPDDFTTTADFWDRFLAQAVNLERDELKPLREVAKKNLRPADQCRIPQT